MRRLVVCLLVVATALAGLMTASPAGATAPGHDGRIALVRDNQIYTIGSDGRGLHRLTRWGLNYRPKWSPDGSRIAFLHETARGKKDVWVMNGDGTGKRQVTQLGTVTADAAWSPRGDWLAFGGRLHASDSPTLLLVQPTAPGGPVYQAQTFLTNTVCGDEPPTERHPLEVDRYVAWSPDGTGISVHNHQDCYFHDSVFIYDPVSDQAREYDATGAECCSWGHFSDLFFGPHGEPGYSYEDLGDNGSGHAPTTIKYAGFTSQRGDAGGAPSPSGNYLAFSNSYHRAVHVYIATRAGLQRHVLTAGYQPDWQPVP